MLKIKVKRPTKPACDMDFEQLFTDADGDLFYRCFEGAVMFDGIGGHPAELCAYSDKELVDYEKFPFLSECTPVEGTVRVKVKLEK